MNATRVLALILALLIPFRALAVAPDAPVAEPAAAGNPVDLAPGDCVASAGRFYDEAAYIALARRLVAAETERDALRQAPIIPPWVSYVVAGAAIAGAAGIGIIAWNELRQR
jgi:hypothetical protein